MKPCIDILHSWNPTIEEGEFLQGSLAARVKNYDDFSMDIKTVAGLDVSYDKSGEYVAGAVIVLNFKTQEIVEEAYSIQRANYPYHPGLFSFREMPPLIEAVSKLKSEPDIFICDGHGTNHPRFFGLACHFGVYFEVPSIGCAKKPFMGKFDNPGEKRGSKSDIIYNDTIVGRALRTQDNIKPVFVSVGNMCSLPFACETILSLCPDFRLPSTTRISNERVNAYLKRKICLL